MGAGPLVRAILRGWVKAALWFRFRSVKIVYHSPPPLETGAIVCGNHQNAMLDSITLAACSPKTPYTLSRGSLFESRVARWLLAPMQMIPIYRFRDGFRRMRENTEVFKGFVDLLRNNQWLLIFPEGSHLIRYTLRPFQKGFARIAFAAQTDQGWEREIPIIPVGLHYESHTTFGSRLLIQFGSPVSSLAFKELHSQNPKEAERALSAELFRAMGKLLILPPSDDQAYNEAIRRWRPTQGRFPDLLEQFEADRRLMADGGGGGSPDMPAPGRAVKGLAGFALSLPGVLLHLPVILLTLLLQKTLLEDPHIVHAWRFTVGLFLVPIWYLTTFLLATMWGGSLLGGLLLAASMPLALWMWSRSWHLTR